MIMSFFQFPSFKYYFILFVLLIANQAYATQYDVQTIGTLGGASTVVAEINNADQILVESQIPSGEYHIGILENGVITDLGLAVPDIDGYDSGYFYGFNDLGHVVGMTTSLSENSLNHFYYNGNSISNLSAILNYAIPADFDSGVTGLNNHGVITAVHHTVYKEAIILRPDGFGGYNMETFGYPGQHNWAMGLNDSGRVFGMTREDLVSPNIGVGVIYDNGNLYETGTLGGTTSHPYDMNEQGDVVGVSRLSSNYSRSYIFSNGFMSQVNDLGGDWSSAFGINDNGVIVGGSYTLNYELHAYLSENGVTVDLNNFIDPDLGWTLQYAWDINNNGVIIGVGTVNGESKSFILTPINEPPSVNIGGPYSGVATLPIQFDGSFSQDPEGQALTYLWDFGDGNTGTGSNPAHAYSSSGNYTVTLVVSDGVLNSELVSTNVNIDNHAPIVNVVNAIEVFDKSTVILDGTLSFDPDGDIVDYQWLQLSGLNIRLLGSTSAVASFRAPKVKKPELVMLELTVTDNEGLSSTDSILVTIVPK